MKPFNFFYCFKKIVHTLAKYDTLLHPRHLADNEKLRTMVQTTDGHMADQVIDQDHVYIVYLFNLV